MINLAFGIFFFQRLPFNNPERNFREAVNEIFVASITYMMIPYTNAFDLDVDFRIKIGYLLIVSTLIYLFFNLRLFSLKAYRQMIGNFKRLNRRDFARFIRQKIQAHKNEMRDFKLQDQLKKAHEKIRELQSLKFKQLNFTSMISLQITNDPLSITGKGKQDIGKETCKDQENSLNKIKLKIKSPAKVQQRRKRVQKFQTDLFQESVEGSIKTKTHKDDLRNISSNEINQSRFTTKAFASKMEDHLQNSLSVLDASLNDQSQILESLTPYEFSSQNQASDHNQKNDVEIGIRKNTFDYSPSFGQEFVSNNFRSFKNQRLQISKQFLND